MMRYFWISVAALAVPAGVAAQAPTMADAQASLQSCAATDTPAAELRQRADEAESRFRTLRRVAPDDNDVRVGLAQVLIRCQLPHASVAGIMALVGEAEAELRSVLAADDSHWNARFTLAMLLRNMPVMLGRGNDAVRELETLIAQQGTRADSGHFVQPWIQLGDLHEAAGRHTAAIATWRRALALFSDHPELVRRLQAAGDTAVPDSAWLSAGVAVANAEAPAPIYAFSPLRAEALNHQFQEARAGTTLRRLDVYTMPGGTGEMLQALQAMPGATRAGDGAELHIRGGDAAETPVFFDGGRLAFPGRWESLQGSAMGVVDASVLRRAYFSSGGFSARYGNALSGIVDVETEGRPTQASYRLGANMVQAGGTVRRPAGERSGAWGTLSATDTRLITRLNGESDLYTRAPQSIQGIGGLSFEPVPGVEARATALSLGDRYTRLVQMNGYAGEFHSRSNMQHVAVSARAVRPDGRRGLSGSVTASRRSSAMAFGVLDREREDRALGGRLESDVALARGTRVRAGVEAQRYHAETEGRLPTTPTLAEGAPAVVLPASQEGTWHAGAYVEAEQSQAAGVAVVGGVRVDRLPGESVPSVDPRVGASYTAGLWTVRAGAGIFHQGSWRARYRLPDPGQPGGVPRRAEHAVVGVERAGTLSLRMEAYLKRYGDFAAAGDGPPALRGANAGMDGIARWSPRSGVNGWVSYSLLRARVYLDDGRAVPSALDVTHTVTSVARLPLGAWEFGATARYASGKPFTSIVGTGAGGEPTYGTVHGERLPAHQRLDGRLTRYFFGQGRQMALLYLEMLNLLDRRNVMSYTYSADQARIPVHSVFAHRTFVLGLEVQF